MGLSPLPFRWPIGWAIMWQGESNRLKFLRPIWSQYDSGPDNEQASQRRKWGTWRIWGAQKGILTGFRTQCLRFALSVIIPPMFRIWTSPLPKDWQWPLQNQHSTKTWTPTTTRINKGSRKRRKFVPPTSDGVELITVTCFFYPPRTPTPAQKIVGIELIRLTYLFVRPKNGLDRSTQTDILLWSRTNG